MNSRRRLAAGAAAVLAFAGGATVVHVITTTGNGRTCTVTNYGADPSGARDSTLAIRNALSDCESNTGDTVYLPAGTYTLDHNDGLTYDFTLSGNPVTINGAGRDSTKLVEEVGLVKYPNLQNKCGTKLCTRGKGVFLTRIDGSALKNLTVDAQTWVAGDAWYSVASNVRLAHDRFLGAKSTPTYNQDTFDVRVLGGGAGCYPSVGPVSGDVINDLILNGLGTAGNADLDISCQRDVRISNIVDSGWGVAFYLDQGITLNGLQYTPGPNQSGPEAWEITASYNVSLSNITVATGAGGGRILTWTNGAGSRQITINNEKMTDLTKQFAIQDASSVSITGSGLGILQLRPQSGGISGLSLNSTTVAKVVCAPVNGATISGLVGVSC
jgi:Pectate lyase superfamily protein